MVSCFSEHAVRISELTCPSTYVNQDHPSIHTTSNISPCVQNAVVYVYKTPQLSTPNKHLVITVTWCKNHLGQGGLCLNFGDQLADCSPSLKLSSFSCRFGRKKGHKPFQVDSSSSSTKMDVYWDLSAARYDSGPEPIDGYYVLVMVGTQLGLALGDMALEAAFQRLGGTIAWPKSVLTSRREHYTGSRLYSTTAQFIDSGLTHEIVIRCSEDQDRLKQPVLHVIIDKKTVVKIRRLQWNFRGNQTVLVDGVHIDLMWDVHEWFFGSGSGHTVFMFKARTGIESSGLLVDDNLGNKDLHNLDFSLLIYSSKNASLFDSI